MVCQHPLRIMSRTCFVAFNRFCQTDAFVVGIIGYLFQPSVSFFINADIQLCPKLYGRFYFVTDYGGVSMAG